MSTPGRSTTHQWENPSCMGIPHDASVMHHAWTLWCCARRYIREGKQINKSVAQCELDDHRCSNTKSNGREQCEYISANGQYHVGFILTIYTGPMLKFNKDICILLHFQKHDNYLFANIPIEQTPCCWSPFATLCAVGSVMHIFIFPSFRFIHVVHVRWDQNVSGVHVENQAHHAHPANLGRAISRRMWVIIVI